MKHFRCLISVESSNISHFVNEAVVGPSKEVRGTVALKASHFLCTVIFLSNPLWPVSECLLLCCYQSVPLLTSVGGEYSKYAGRGGLTLQVEGDTEGVNPSDSFSSA